MNVDIILSSSLLSPSLLNVDISNLPLFVAPFLLNVYIAFLSSSLTLSLVPPSVELLEKILPSAI